MSLQASQVIVRRSQKRIADDGASLKIEIEANTETSRKHGKLITAKVNITPDHLFQVHQFIYPNYRPALPN